MVGPVLYADHAGERVTGFVMTPDHLNWDVTEPFTQLAVFCCVVIVIIQRRAANTEGERFGAGQLQDAIAFLDEYLHEGISPPGTFPRGEDRILVQTAVGNDDDFFTAHDGCLCPAYARESWRAPVRPARRR